MTPRIAGRARSLLATVLVLGAAAAVYVAVAQGAGPASPGHGRGPETYTVGLFGDMPYGALGRSQHFRAARLTDLNRQHARSLTAAAAARACKARRQEPATPRWRARARV